MMRFQDGSGISWTICKQSAPCSTEITTPTVQHLITQFFADWMLFLTPNQQCHSTEGISAIPIYRMQMSADMSLCNQFKQVRVQLPT